MLVKWLTTNMYFSGGVFYAVAAVFYVALDTGPCLWKGEPPSPRRRVCITELVQAVDDNMPVQNKTSILPLLSFSPCAVRQ
jgi:hypothetical protein